MPFKHYAQRDAMDCGPTCLQMIARQHGRYYPQPLLRDWCYIDREGVSLAGISDAAERIGFRTLAVKVGYDKIWQDAPMPCIVHWNQNHFVVIYKATAKHVWVADPGAGKFKLTRAEFERGASPNPNPLSPPKGDDARDMRTNIIGDDGQGTREYITTQEQTDHTSATSSPFGGQRGSDESETDRASATSSPFGGQRGSDCILLLLEPTPNFYQTDNDVPNLGEGWGTAQFMLGYLRPYTRLVAQLGLGLLVGSLLQLLFPILTQALMDTGIANADVPFLYVVLLGQAMLFFAQMTVEMLRSWILLHYCTMLFRLRK